MNHLVRTPLLAAALGAVALTAACERPPVETVQRGYRGTGMEHVENPRLLAQNIALHLAPEPLPPIEAAEGEPKASEVYENVYVLGELSVGEFGRLMQAITEWVVPGGEDCTYCHNPENFAEEGLYTKTVSRLMLQMTQHINSEWDSHVGNVGVTCYTCHRGQPVPQEIWFNEPPQRNAATMVGNRAGQNIASPVAAYSSLPEDPFSPFLLDDQEIRLRADTALPSGNRSSIKQAEWTYSLMMHMSDSLGVNCTYCHNSRAFGSWAESSPARTTAWYGLRMTNELNVAFLEPLEPVYPHYRLGPTGDAPKANCGTCHLGAYKPLYGANMLQYYPALAGPLPLDTAAR